MGDDSRDGENRVKTTFEVATAHDFQSDQYLCRLQVGLFPIEGVPTACVVTYNAEDPTALVAALRNLADRVEKEIK